MCPVRSCDVREIRYVVTSERDPPCCDVREIRHVVTSERERSAMLWRQTFFYSLHCSYTKRCHSLSEIVHVHVHLQVANKTKDDYTRRLVLWGKIEQLPSIINTSSFRPHSWLTVDSVDVSRFCRRHLACRIHSLAHAHSHSGKAPKLIDWSSYMYAGK